LDNVATASSLATPIVYSWWLKFWNKTSNDVRTEGQEKARKLLTSPAVRETIRKTAQQCKDDTDDEAGIRFAVLETHVKTNVCLRSFSWLYWPLGEYDLKLHPKSALILNGTNVDVGLIVSFQPDHLDTQTSAQIRDARLLEAKGLTAESLIFEFSETKSSYSTQLDGLKFGRIHSNLANCQFKSETSIGKASGSSQRPQPPNVYQVATWLTRNKTPTSSSQPFAAFADAFEHIGEDATALRVARSNQELWDKTIDWWNTPPISTWLVHRLVACNIYRHDTYRIPMGPSDSSRSWLSPG
jgi:hypothetical protein